jgi:acylphosphatase
MATASRYSDSAINVMIGKRVQYSGRVQGVGFRYTAQNVAEGFAVAGYVRNLPDGDVELVAEGEPAEVDTFLAAIAARLGHHLSGSRIEEIEPGGHKGFRIRY